ncbi:MAG: ABC transporter ATP-binding protein [Candidatus Micrarchaeota archaeon]|nr:ABC transporter ATP-binding protein [Candidatus Micrarchaeota archaeon]
MDGIVCKGISKTYDGRNYALKGVSLSFPSRGIIALIGRNGAGKTTLVRILATQLMPSGGKAYINGVDVVKEPARVRDMIAIVPQEARAIPWLSPYQTVFSYLLYRGFGYGEARKRVKEALRKLGLGHQENKLNRMLSGGTKRKVMVATVLSSGAKVIFLDEPTTGLDPISRADLWNLLNALKKEYLIFLTTHYLEEAEHLADRIGIIEEGRLLAIGSMDELRKKVGHQYSIRVTQATRPKAFAGMRTTKIDGGHQLMTSERKAFEITNRLVRERVRFSTNPISLEDIFYHFARRQITEENGEGEEW